MGPAQGPRRRAAGAAVMAALALAAACGGGAPAFAQGGVEGVVLGERTQPIVGWAQGEAQAAAADLVDPARALGRRHAVEQVGDAGDLLRHALEQRAAADALALAEEEREAHREHQRDADQPDQHQAGEQAARQRQPHRGPPPPGAAVLVSTSAATSVAST